jgi:hypothetical protein
MKLEVATGCERVESFAKDVLGVCKTGKYSSGVDKIELFCEAPILIFGIVDFETAVLGNTKLVSLQRMNLGGINVLERLNSSEIGANDFRGWKHVCCEAMLIILLNEERLLTKVNCPDTSALVESQNEIQYRTNDN